MELFTLEGEVIFPNLLLALFSIALPTLIWNSFHIDFLFFQVCLVFGTLILLAGLIVVLVGYATPTRIEAFGGDDLLFVDRYKNRTEQMTSNCGSKISKDKNSGIILCDLNFN